MVSFSAEIPRRLMLALSLTLLALPGCGGRPAAPATKSLPPAVTDAITRSSPVDSGLVAANNAFGFDLLGRLVKASPNDNVFISPTSIALALEIVTNGANGSTLADMEQTLHLQGKRLADLNTQNAALQASLVSADPLVQLNIANSLWIHKDRAEVLPGFVQTNTTYYGSDIGDLTGAPDNINAWVNQRTKGKIPTIVETADYSQIASVVVNAVYFKGKWSKPFDPLHTRAAPFTLLDGTTMTTPMMRQEDTFSYYQGSDFQAVRLPYGNKRLSLLVVLPNTGTDWNHFLSELTADNLNAWLPKFTDSVGNIALPRFESAYGANLNTTLSALGMASVFDANRADFSNLAPHAFISDVMHKTYLRVDELGTEAAAATAVAVMAAGVSVPQGFQMTMDHPFFCAIRDDTTGVLLFMGCIVHPVVPKTA